MKNDGETISTFSLLDNGNRSTLIRKDFARKLKLKGYFRAINIRSIKDETESVKVKGTSLKIYDMDHKNKLEVEAYTLPKRVFNMPSQSSPTNGDNQNIFNHPQDIQIPKICSSEVAILIGANAPEVFLQLEVRKGNPSQPYAIKTILGWSLLGNNTKNEKPQKGGREYHINHIGLLQHDEMLDQIVKQFWETEDCLNANSRETAMSIEDKQCLKVLESGTKIVNGKYEVLMLWKQIDRLPNNHEMAMRRLRSLHKRFLGNPDLFEKYNEIINTYIKYGYARKMTKEETINTSNKTWYLPHHPVFHPQKPGKVRAVFNAAAKYKGKSLNKELFTDPDLLKSLVGVLLRFQNHKIALVEDVEAMFYQVRVKPSDIDALRFLWAD